MKDIQMILKGIKYLKPFPKTLHKIMALANEPQVNMNRLAEAIAHDPMLTANILRSANSAYYGRSSKCETAKQAVVFLGVSEIFNLVLMAGCKGALSTAQEGYDLQSGELWHYSLSSAMLAKAVAVRANIVDTQLVFTASILKDIGKVILSQYLSDSHDEIRTLVNNEGCSFREAEERVLGIDHAQLGALVAKEWRFSPKLQEIIRFHHQPLQCRAAPMSAAAVYMGDVLCMMLGIGVGADGLAYRFQQDVVQLLKLSDTDIQLLLLEFVDNLEEISGLFDTTGSDSSTGV